MNSNSLTQRATILVCLAMPLSCFSGESSLPNEWRLPTPVETTPEQGWRSESPDRYLTTSADFNGDGVVDKAMLLVRKKGAGFALFALVSQKDSASKPYLLDEIQNTEYIKVMGVSIAQSGKYKTACGKGYFECQEGEQDEIVLRHPAIDYFKEGSANSFFYWDEGKKEF